MNQKYFGNRNIGSSSTAADDNIGGQGVASVTIGGVWSGFTQATSTVTFSAPQLPGGVTATGTVTITTGAPTLVTITEQGSGYTAAPTVTIADSDVGAETSGTATAVLTTDSGAVGSSTNQENAITVFAKTTDATTTAQVADIIKQRSTKRFKVMTANGTAICELKSSALSSSASTDTNKMTITATDSAGGTYFVTKIGARRCTVTRGTGTQFATESSVAWTFGAAVANQSVTLANA